MVVKAVAAINPFFIGGVAVFALGLFSYQSFSGLLGSAIVAVSSAWMMRRLIRLVR